jgi:hypothetical protein
MAQAISLDAIYNRLAMLAIRTDHIPTLDACLRLALRAQNQSRATLETLAAIKNPPVVFAKQANIAAGHQQVNNNSPAPSPTPPRTRDIEGEPTKLSVPEEHHELLPDTGAPAPARRVDPPMETMGEVHRAPDQRG